tara:strand:- start:15315 stop:17972 length:2658 start_codon:yes stop_codon:yes gene_type:complete
VIISTGYEDNSWGISPNSKIILRWREQEDGRWVRKERFEKTRPYLFINPQMLYMKRVKNTSGKGFSDLTTYRHVPQHLVESTIKEHLFGIDIEFEKGEFYNAEGYKLLKVYLDKPLDVYRFRRNFTRTYEADVPIEDRYLIDNYEELPEYEMRKLFIDLEALQFRVGEGPTAHPLRPNDPRDNQEINVIGAYDSYTKKYYQWCMHPNFEEDIALQRYDGEDSQVKYFHDEARMLEDFVEFVDAIDPDVLLAWGMGFYDLPTLYRRLESTGVGAHKLVPSSMGRSRLMKPPRYKGVQYRWTEQPLPGRIVISLDKLYERIYRDSKSTNLPSMKLDVVGQTLFGRGKTQFRPDFYDADYDEFIDSYLYYNLVDVKLMVEIEASCNAIEGQQNLQALAKCQFKSTLYGSSYARVYFMRKADFKQGSGWSDAGQMSDWELQGAIVLDPEELGTVGLHKNVTMLDFSGLYPSMMVAFNTSHETLVPKGQEQDDDIIGDRCRFRKNPVGLLPKCVMELDVLRDEYKRLRAEAGETHGKGSDEYKKWDDAQKTVKRLRATFYGLMAFNGFAWSNINIARTITYGGRKSLMLIKKECEAMGYEVIYGHTDSIFVKLGDEKTPEECAKLATELGERLTEICQKDLNSTAVEVEAETLMDRFYLPRRNRYAGRVVWDPSLKDPFSIQKVDIKNRMKMQGLEAKHANTAKIGRDAQFKALELIWDGASTETVVGAMKDHIAMIRSGEVLAKDLFSRARLGKWLPSQHEHPLIRQGATNQSAKPDAKDETDQCYAVLGGVHRAAAWYNVVLADDTYPKMDKGDSYYTTFVKDGPTWIPSGGYVAFQDPDQIKDYVLDLDKIIEKNVIDKLDHMLYGIGSSNQVLRESTKQYKITDFM